MARKNTTKKTDKSPDLTTLHKAETEKTRRQKAQERNQLLNDLVGLGTLTRAQIFDAIRVSYAVADATIAVALSDIKNPKYATKLYGVPLSEEVKQDDGRKVFRFKASK